MLGQYIDHPRILSVKQNTLWNTHLDILTEITKALKLPKRATERVIGRR